MSTIKPLGIQKIRALGIKKIKGLGVEKIKALGIDKIHASGLNNSGKNTYRNYAERNGKYGTVKMIFPNIDLEKILVIEHKETVNNMKNN